MRKILVFVGGLLSLFCCNGQKLSLLTTLNTDKIGSQPSDKLTIGSTTFFTADDGIHGRELWKTDGTAGGTQLVKDINPGYANSGILWLSNLNGLLLFMATDGTNGNKVWRSDGTDAGTVIISPANSKAVNVQTTENNFKPIVYNNYLYFFGTDPVYGGNEVWKTDGTIAGTTILKDIATVSNGSYWSGVGLFTIVNNKLFFIQNSSSNSADFQIWKTNGSTAGTVKITNITDYPKLTKLTKVGNYLYFINYSNSPQNLLCFIYETSSSTKSVEVLLDIPTFMAECNGKLIFNKRPSANSSSQQLFIHKPDSLNLGNSVFLKSLYTPITSSSSNNFILKDSSLFFLANNDSSGYELWKTDATSQGTVMVKDINMGSKSAFDATANNQIYKFNNSIYFTADDDINGTELWKSDGTANGTLLINNAVAGCVSNNPSKMTLNGSSIIYSGTDGFSGNELWKLDTSVIGSSSRILDIKVMNEQNLSGIDNSSIPINYKNELYFSGVSQVYGAELYKTQGSLNTTQVVKDIFDNCKSSNPNNFTIIDSTLYFTANDNLGNELWKTNGKTNGTSIVKDIVSGFKGSKPRNLTKFNNYLLFFANDSINNIILWKTDGTDTGTSKIYTIYSNNYSISDNLAVVGNSIYFTASDYRIDGLPITTLFISNGNIGGTQTIKNTYSYSPFLFKELNGKLIFGTRDVTDAFGQELWISDGTTAGTKVLKDINKSTNTGFYASTFPLIDSNVMYFQGTDSTFNSEFWKTDGTTNGTVIVKNIDSNNSSSADNFTKLNGFIYFTATTVADGRELWKSDGTNNGTTLLKNIALGSKSSNPTKLTRIGNFIYFFASDSGAFFNGTNFTQSLWRTDGTDAGTIKISDFAGDLGSGLGIYKSGSFIYATGSTKKDNYQIWVADFDTSSIGIFGRIVTLSNKLPQKETISLTGDANLNTYPDANGEYNFKSLSIGNYTIRPTKNNDITKANGLNATDVLFVQRHILGSPKLNSAYKIIAADVNGDKLINATDLLRIKRLILGTDTTFTKGSGATKIDRLWEFVDSAYIFPDTANPFPFKDSISFTNLTSNKINQTFIGVKLGDVNDSWNAALPRSLATKAVEFVYTLRNEELGIGNSVVRIPITVNNFKELIAMQYTLHFDNSKYELVGIENNKLDIDFNSKQANNNGNISFVWTDKNAIERTLEDGTELFVLVLIQKGIGNLELEISDAITEIAAWDKDYNQHNIILTQKSKAETQNLNDVWSFSPNPTSGDIKVSLVSKINKTMSFELTDAQGKTILKQAIELQKGNNSFTLNLKQNGNITTGIYFLKAVGLKGEHVKRVVVR